MKLSYNWLKDYLEFDLTPAKIAEVMTDIGIEDWPGWLWRKFLSASRIRIRTISMSQR